VSLRVCRCATPRLDRTADGAAFCGSCGEEIDARQASRDRVLVALLHQVRDLRRRVSELEARTPNANDRNGANGEEPDRDQLTLEEAR
jgi:hypothetical protein